jgi:hypothetical protein
MNPPLTRAPTLSEYAWANRPRIAAFRFWVINETATLKNANDLSLNCARVRVMLAAGSARV